MDVFWHNELLRIAWRKLTNTTLGHSVAVVDKDEVLICYYFQRGFDYLVILLFLEKNHTTSACL